ncbi:hypothetical protein [Burkholderia gladioli]|nr:hypothetical protein [Burkholderia gladioli]
MTISAMAALAVPVAIRIKASDKAREAPKMIGEQAVGQVGN